MGTADLAGGGGGSGGTSGLLGGGGGPSTSGAPKVRKPRSPEHDLTNSLVRLARTLPNVSGGDAQRIVHTIQTKAPGLKRGQLAQVANELRSNPQYHELGQKLLTQASTPHEKNTALDYLNPVTAAGSVLGKTLDVASAPGQATLSTIAEATREGGWQHADLGKLAKAAWEGLQHKRQDTISSIVQENTGYKLKGVGRFAADLGGSIATDPLTYASFGLSDAAKVGIRGATDVLGAERTAQVIQRGASILDAEEKARLAKQLTKPAYDAFIRGSRGGLKLARPTVVEKAVPFTKGRVTRPGLQLTEGRTVIPGPFTKAKAGRIIEGQGAHLSGDAAAEAARAAEVAATASRRAEQLHAEANLAELAGGDANRITFLRDNATQFEDLARQAESKVGDLEGTAVRSAAEAARTLTNNPVTRAAQKLGDSGVASALRGTFIPRGNVRHLYGEAAAKGLDDARVLYRGEFQATVEDHVNQLLHAAKDTGVTNDELVHVIGPALDIGGDAATVPERLRPMYDALVDVRNKFTQAQIDAGVAREQALHLTDEYFPRYITAEARKVLTGRDRAQVIPAVPGEATITRAPSGQLRRRTADVDSPIADINPAFQAEHGVKKFEDNPLTAISRRGTEAAQDVATQHYVGRVLKLRDDSGNRLVYTADEVRKNKLKLPNDWVEEKVPGVGTIHAPKEIIGEVKKAQELLVNDQHLKGFIDGLDRWMTLWKGYATVPLPFGLGFHERNAIGNVFNNWLKGIRPSSPSYARAAKIQQLVAKGRKEGDVLKYLAGEDRRIVEEARAHDIIGEGFYGFDLPKNQDVAVHVPFRQATKSEKARRVRSASNPFNPSNALIASGRKFGSAIEENARLAHFIEMEHRYGDAADAARSVRETLFDYSDLTATERHVFKRGMAFYTFTRKNLPLQVGALLRTPGKFSHLRAAQNAVADTAETPKGLYPSYLPELGGTPLPLSISRGLAKVPGLGVQGDQQLVFAPDLPLTNATSAVSPAIQLLASLPGVNKIPGVPKNPEGAGGAFRDLVTQTISGGAPGAVMSGVQALGAEKDFFSGRPLTGRVAAPLYAKIPGLSQDRVLNGKNQPTITSKGQYLAESLFPLLGKVSSFAPQGAYEQEKAPRRRLSTLAGLRVYPLGPGTSRGEALRRNSQIAALMAELRAKGVTVESSRTSKKKKKVIP